MKYLLTLASLVLLTAATPAYGADVYVIHGIPGGDLGVDPTLPVDISVGGNCVLQNFTFGSITGPVQLDPGKYDVEVRLASTTPCQGALAIVSTVFVSLAENISLVAHLSEQGTPALAKFVNDVRSADAGQARIIVRHGAAAPAVNVTLRAPGNFRLISGLRNGDQLAEEVPAGDWTASVLPGDTFFDTLGVRVLGPAAVNLQPATATFVYAVGSLKTGSIALVVHVLPLT